MVLSFRLEGLLNVVLELTLGILVVSFDCLGYTGEVINCN